MHDLVTNNTPQKTRLLFLGQILFQGQNSPICVSTFSPIVGLIVSYYWVNEVRQLVAPQQVIALPNSYNHEIKQLIQ